MMLDSFQPEKPEDIVRLKALQAEIHKEFADLVRERRGKKIEAARAPVIHRRVLERKAGA